MPLAVGSSLSASHAQLAEDSAHLAVRLVVQRLVVETRCAPCAQSRCCIASTCTTSCAKAEAPAPLPFTQVRVMSEA